MNGNAELQDKVGQQHQNYSAKQRPERTANSAGQGDAAQHGGDNGIQLVSSANPVIDLIQLPGQHHARNSCEYGGDHIATDFDPIGIDSNQTGGLFV